MARTYFVSYRIRNLGNLIRPGDRTVVLKGDRPRLDEYAIRAIKEEIAENAPYVSGHFARRDDVHIDFICELEQ